MSDRDSSDALAELMRQQEVGEVDVRWIGEKSTSYLETPRVATRIAEVHPGAQVFVILRDPVSRAISNYLFSVANGLENLAAKDALTQEAESRRWDKEKVSVSPYRYLGRGRYWDLLMPWLEVFPNLQVLVLEEVLAAPHEHLGSVASSMGFRVGDFANFGRDNAGSQEPVLLDPEVEDALVSYFRSPNRALFEALGREVPAWR